MNTIVKIFMESIYCQRDKHNRPINLGAFKTREDYTNILSFEIMFDPLYKDVAHIIVFTTFKNMPENLFKGIKYARVSGLVFRQDDKLRMIRGVSGRRFTSNHYALLFDEKNSTTLV